MQTLEIKILADLTKANLQRKITSKKAVLNAELCLVPWPLSIFRLCTVNSFRTTWSQRKSREGFTGTG